MAIAQANVRDIRRSQRADGPAAILAIGTANPPNCVSQNEYADYYFRVTKSEHLTGLIKDTFKTICRLTGMKKRFFHHTEELLNAHPDVLHRTSPSSLDARLDIVAAAAPELAALAATKAIAKWDRPAADITHLVVSTNSGADAPSADLRLAALLGLRHDVRSTMLHLNGCASGCAALRLAKDLAENNRGARVLVACVELTITNFRAPDQRDNFHTLISQGLFGDGAGAVIVGADPVYPVERPLFEMASASQAVIPETQHLLTMQLRSGGIGGNISTKLPSLVVDNVQRLLLDAFDPLGVTGVKWNGLFWAVHPGSSTMLDHIDGALLLEPGKLGASRTVVRDYGNMLSATVIFVLDEQRRRMEQGEEADCDWGVLMGFGPGFAIEIMVLHATGELKRNSSSSISAL